MSASLNSARKPGGMVIILVRLTPHPHLDSKVLFLEHKVLFLMRWLRPLAT